MKDRTYLAAMLVIVWLVGLVPMMAAAEVSQNPYLVVFSLLVPGGYVLYRRFAFLRANREGET